MTKRCIAEPGFPREGQPRGKKWGGKTDQSCRVNSGRPVKNNYIVCTGELATSLLQGGFSGSIMVAGYIYETVQHKMLKPWGD